MKTTITSLFILLPLWAFTQSCPDFERLMREGNQAKDYETAFKKYDAADAVACTEALREQARAKKSELLKKINALKEKAEATEAEVKRAAAQLEEEQKKTLVERNAALEALRLNKLMSDSVAQATNRAQKANESIALLIQVNDMEALGNIALQKEDYATALNYFSDIQRILDQATDLDSSLFIKQKLISEKVVLLNEQWAKVRQFETLLAAADSLENQGVKGLSGAFERYLAAGALNLKPELVLKELGAAEQNLQNNWRAANRLPADEYLDLLLNSTKAFDFSGNQLAYRRRAAKIGRLPYLDLSQIEDPQIRKLAGRYQQSFWHRLSITAGMRYRFGQQSRKPLMTLTLGNSFTNVTNRSVDIFIEKLNPDQCVDFGVHFKLSKMISIGAGFNFRKYQSDTNFENEVNISNLLVNEIDSSYNTVITKEQPVVDRSFELFEPFYTTWNWYLNVYIDVLKFWNIRSPVGIQLVTGLENNYQELFRAYTMIQNLQATPLSSGWFNYFIEAPTDIDYLHVHYTSVSNGMALSINDGRNYQNDLQLLLGLRFTFEPIRAFRNIGIFSEISYRQSIPGMFQPRKHFNFAEWAIEKFPYDEYSDYSQAQIDQFFSELRKHYDIDITLDSRHRQLLYAWNLHTGIYYRF
ncbi:MAG: hypothetical protein JNJ57_08410 [Saprospiraceae bacterium]|nr:hypothetical protein [Saprospiraceae bacterium]